MISSLITLIESSCVTAFILNTLFQFFDISAGILLSFVILRSRPKKKVYPYVILVAFCVFNAFLYFTDFMFKDDFGYISVIVSPLIVFPLSKKQTYKYCIIALLTDIVIGIAGSLLIAATGNNYESLSNNNQLAYNFIVSTLIFILVFFIAVISARKGEEKPLIARIKLPILFMVVATVMIFSMTMIHFQINFSTKPSDLLLCLLNIVLLGVTIFYVVKSFLKSKLSEEKYKTQLEQQIKHFEILEEKNREIRVFRHDMPKKLRPLAMYLDEGNYAEAKSILNEFDVSIEKSRSGFDSGNFMLDTVLESEQQLAKKSGVDIVLVHGSVFPKNGIEAQDIYTIFPNALDNAIEATEKVFDAEKTITFESFIKQGKVYIKISNPFVGNIKSNNVKLSTTKTDKENHGYGFSSMKKAAAKYGSNNVSFTTENNMFVLTISLRIPE